LSILIINFFFDIVLIFKRNPPTNWWYQIKNKNIYSITKSRTISLYPKGEVNIREIG